MDHRGQHPQKRSPSRAAPPDPARPVSKPGRPGALPSVHPAPAWHLRIASTARALAGSHPRPQPAPLIPPPRWLALALLGFAFLQTCVANPPNEARVRALTSWLPPRPAGVGRPVADRAAWAPLLQQPAWQAVIREAEQLVREGLPDQPDDLYLDYSRTGNRERWQRVAFARRGRIATFVLAEAVENRGRFLAPLEETIQALCAERTWVYPAHDGALRNFRGEVVEMDLGSTALSWDLATAHWLLGDKLSESARRLIRENLQRRTLRPFRAMIRGEQPEAFWLRATHNWNAVCLAGTVGTALAMLDSPEDRAWFVAVAEERIRSFLAGFTPDGYCSEGLGYWNYGFGHFVWLSEMLRLATEGKLDLLADPQAQMPARFPWRAEILNGFYPTISDCTPGTRPDSRVVRVLSGRLGLPPPGGVTPGRPQPGRALAITVLAAFLPEPLPPLEPPKDLPPLDPLRTWFTDAGVLICRPRPGEVPFAVCLKGGHNAEHHNHNDLGSFSVVFRSRMLLCDPGAEVYTARTFSARRYESKVLSSYGHSVPVVDGRLQQTGAHARARVLETDFRPGADRLRLELKSAYDVPGLTSLEREFFFQRGTAPELQINDSMTATRPVSFETALITWSPWTRREPNILRVGEGPDTVEIRIDPAGAAFEIRAETLEEEVPTPQRPRRVAIRLTEPAPEARIRLFIRPVLD